MPYIISYTLIHISVRCTAYTRIQGKHLYSTRTQGVFFSFNKLLTNIWRKITFEIDFKMLKIASNNIINVHI